MRNCAILWCEMATIDLNLSRAFVAVHETKSFSAAAHKLGVPRSTVSRAIAALEQALDTQLFQRTTRAVSATAAAEELYERLSPALRSLENVFHDVPEPNEAPSGTLRIASVPDLAVSVLAQATARFTTLYPLVKVELELSPRLVDLVREGFDLALRISAKPLKDSTLVSRRVGTMAVALYAAPAYLARRGLPRTPDQLAQHDWVAYRKTSQLSNGRRSQKLVFNERITCPDVFFVRQAVSAGGGLGELPMFLAELDVASGALVRVLPKWTAFSGGIYLVRPGSKHVAQRVRAFTAILDEIFHQRSDFYPR